MYNTESQSPREIILSEMKFGEAYDERLTEASLILASMQRGNLKAFDEAVKRFKWLNEQMSYKQIYNHVFGYVKFGFHKPVHIPAEDDDYASGEEWEQLWKFTKKEAKY